ncbi:MAG: energy transducer TonB [Chitinophagaceae bacterium]|nr:energy transducer TonB [Chitinophagaceae bacterium]
MSDKEKNIIYTARDIEQYLAGNLSPLQMHAMEKAALDDPFLAEAMEGYETVQNKEWNNQLVALRQEITNKGTVAKIIPLHKSKTNWWKAAAAVIIIGGGATFTVLFNNNKKEDTDKIQIAQAKTTVIDSILLPENTQSASVTENLNPSASATTEQKNNLPGSVAKLNELAKTEDKYIPNPDGPQLKPVTPVATATAPENDNTIAAAPPVNNPSAAGNNADLAKEMNAEKSKQSAKQNDDDFMSQQRSQAPAKRDAVLNNFFTAQVVSPDNSPLPFTNISIKKENFGTYADAKGMVRLVSTDSVLQVEVKSVGYQAKTFALRSNQAQTKIILQEDEIALKDKTIIGNADITSTKRSRRAMLLRDSAVNVEPADGWDNYNTYVANNLDIPESKLQGNVHGEVELTFDVKSNGTISNIRVNKSLGTEYDEAAKRLLKEGPQWKVKKGKKTSASIKVQF